jgi:hypothetical protein
MSQLIPNIFTPNLRQVLALGHASVAFTMDTYSHIMAGMQSDAMVLLDEVMPVGKNGAPRIYANS